MARALAIIVTRHRDPEPLGHGFELWKRLGAELRTLTDTCQCVPNVGCIMDRKCRFDRGTVLPSLSFVPPGSMKANTESGRSLISLRLILARMINLLASDGWLRLLG